jgi:hypothetical protein
MAAPRVVLGKYFAALFVVTVLLFAAAPMSSAEPITIRFTLIPDPADRINLDPSHGTFTFDSSIIPAGGGEVMDDAARLASDISFRWGSTMWTEENAGVVFLRFLPSGQVHDFRFGGAPNGVLAIFHTPIDDFWGNSVVMNYTLLGQAHEHFFTALVSSPDIPVPEPATFLLFGAGAAYLVRRRSGSRVQ